MKNTKKNKNKKKWDIINSTLSSSKISGDFITLKYKTNRATIINFFRNTIQYNYINQKDRKKSIHVIKENFY